MTAIDVSSSSLNGLRFMSFAWVLVYHFYQFIVEMIPVMNIDAYYNEITSGFMFRPVLNVLAADTFFFVSGLVLAYTTFKELDRRQGFLNPVKFYVRRFMRMMGLYIMVLNFHNTIYKFMNFGPNSSVEATVELVYEKLRSGHAYFKCFVPVFAGPTCGRTSSS